MKRLKSAVLMVFFTLAFGAVAETNLPPFYRELAQDGAWFKLDGKAWVWQPKAAQLDAAWRPYLHAGNWTRHDENWFWASDYAWGAIAFHHGRWHRSATNGWVWAPGTQWCPAWVDWRITDTHAGWAPLPPDGDFFAAIGVDPPERDWSLYSFVPNPAFLSRNLPPYVSDGSGFAAAAVGQVAGPATDRVGIAPAIRRYAMAPIYYATSPTIIIIRTEE